MTSQSAAKMMGLKQETIAIVAVGLTILGTILLTTSRLEARIDRVQANIDHVQANIDRGLAEARAEARADREAFSRDREASARDREAFSREILRLTAGQSRLAGIVEGLHPE